MLTPTMIARLIASDRPGQLLDAIISNGQYLPRSVHAHLLHSPVSLLALGLKRVVELSRGPHPARDQLTRDLLDAQLEDGSFDADPLATAYAVAALASLMQDRQGASPEVCQAHDRAVEALAAMQDGQGLFGDSEIRQGDRMRASACVLHLLSRDALACDRLNLTHLLDVLERQPSSMDRDTQSYLRIARASMPRSRAA